MSNYDVDMIIKKLEEVYIQVKENWNDDIGKQYILWLEKIITEVKKILYNNERINEKSLIIYKECRNILQDNTSDDTENSKQKILRKKR